ncbi:MAG: hypothetical protein MJ101_06995 [Clostridia bacterium]|nr:hypothetical protein [Clostridia bacterium]
MKIDQNDFSLPDTEDMRRSIKKCVKDMKRNTVSISFAFSVFDIILAALGVAVIIMSFDIFHRIDKKICVKREAKRLREAENAATN